jgi:hypothetical protein
MANEAIVFSITSAARAAGAARQAGGDNVAVAEKDTGVVTASIDVGLYGLKAAFNGQDGKSQLLHAIDQIRAKVVESTFPILP